LHSQLGFSDADLKRDSLCIAKSSFKITKAISFSQVLAVINGFEIILATMTPIDINNVRKLNKQMDKDTIKKLRLLLVYKLFQRYKKIKNAYSFDICHSEFEKYLTADHYVIRKGSKIYNNEILENLVDYDQLCSLVIEVDDEQKNLHSFLTRYSDLVIESYDSNSALLTKGRASTHIIADLEIDGERYFFIDNSWYQINSKYIEQLNDECNSFINSSYHTIAMIPWDSRIRTENEYNSLYFSQSNCLVLDKILHENIEVCDILKWDEDDIYLYHVKIGMGNTMRDLCSQVFISAQRIQRDIKSNFNYLSLFYDSLRSKIGETGYFDKAGQQTEVISKSKFLELFRKKIHYVLVIQDDVIRARSIKNIEKYNSNIAKLSISELSKKMRGINVPIEIIQI
jgi:uncharacterized protein (TIGR04141 family)